MNQRCFPCSTVTNHHNSTLHFTCDLHICHIIVITCLSKQKFLPAFLLFHEYVKSSFPSSFSNHELCLSQLIPSDNVMMLLCLLNVALNSSFAISHFFKNLEEECVCADEPPINITKSFFHGGQICH